jgi:hypothetical protein
MKKHLKFANVLFKKIISPCLFPTEFHYFEQQKSIFFKKVVKRVGNKQNRRNKKYNLKKRKLFFDQIFNLDRSRIETKLCHFEDLMVTGGGEFGINPENPTPPLMFL